MIACRLFRWTLAIGFDGHRAAGPWARHARRCPACRETLRRHGVLAERLSREAPAAPPVDHAAHARIMAAVRMAAPRRPAPAPQLRYAALAAVALAVALGLWMHLEFTRPKTQQTLPTPHAPSRPLAIAGLPDWTDRAASLTTDAIRAEALHLKTDADTATRALLAHL